MKISVCAGPQEKTSSCLNEIGSRRRGGGREREVSISRGNGQQKAKGDWTFEAEVDSHDCPRDEVLLGRWAS